MTIKNKTTPASTPSAPGPDFLGREFIITREFNAPRRLVWKAWTEASRLAQWWGPRGFTVPVCDWDPKPGNKIHVLMRAPNGMDFPMGGLFHEVVAPKRLVTTTGPLDEKGRLLFEIRQVLTLEQHSGKTKLTLHATVVKTTPGAGRYIGGFEAGMTQSLVRLEELLNTGGEPLVIVRTLRAPVAQVWRALTQLNEIRRWFFDLEEFKPEVGFKFEFAVEHKGFNYRHVCKVTAVIPEKRIAYTWRYKGFKGDSLVTYDLVPEGRQTRLILTHAGLETFPETRSFARKNFLQGWTFISGALKEFVESPTAGRDKLVSRAQP